MKKILVSGASGIVGYGILRSLRQIKDKYILIGSSIYGDSVAPAFCDIFEQAPHTNSAEYLSWLIEILKRYEIDLLIPGIEIDMYHWAQHDASIRMTGAIPLLNAFDLISLCKDKWEFYNKIKQTQLSYVIDTSLSTDYDYIKDHYGLPFLLKPRHGYGSKGIVRVNTKEVFQKLRNRIGDVLMVQPIVGTDEEEYTTSAFCDGLGGYYAAMTMRRKLSSDGYTEKAEVADSSEFIAVIQDLCALLKPIGPTNFQFRLCQEGPKLLEINPRISSSTSIRSAFGYNESIMAFEYYLENKIPIQPEIRKGRAVRYTDEIIYYEDGIYI